MWQKTTRNFNPMAPPTEPEKTVEPSKVAEEQQSQPQQQHQQDNDDDPEKEVVSGNWQLPQVQLKESHDPTGEESEREVWKQRSKLFRWDRGEWRERGLGESKLLQDSSEKIRFLLRQEKTNKVVANHYVLPVNGMCKLIPNAASDKIWIWSVLDSAEEPTVERFALKFAQVAEATKFKEEFIKAAQQNLKLFDQGKFGMKDATRNPDMAESAQTPAATTAKSDKPTGETAESDKKKDETNAETYADKASADGAKSSKDEGKTTK